MTTNFEHGDDVSVSLHLKLPADSSIREAHEIAERVEREIAARPHVIDVRTHLEPPERRSPPTRRSPSMTKQALATITTITREQTGGGPHDLRLLPTDAGSVLSSLCTSAPVRR